VVGQVVRPPGCNPDARTRLGGSIPPHPTAWYRAITAERVGYPPEFVDNENQATPVGVDTAGDVSKSAYNENRFSEINGKCFDLDGFHDGEVRGNTCVNKGDAGAYPNGHFAVVFNNNDPRMKSQGVRIIGNTFEGMKFGGVFLIGQGQTIEDNTFTRINTARCNDRLAFGCLYLQTEPDLLRTGIYLSRGVKRLEETRGNSIRGNRISGYGMKARCVVAGPGVALKDDVIAAIHVVRNPDKLQFLERQLSGA